MLLTKIEWLVGLPDQDHEQRRPEIKHFRPSAVALCLE